MLLCIMHAVLWVTYVSSASYLFNPQTASYIDSLSRHSSFGAGEEINKKMTPYTVKALEEIPQMLSPQLCLVYKPHHELHSYVYIYLP